jgi:putative ABC transport system permease protein
MNLGPILRSLLHNKTRLILISLEVALTLAIVVNCLNLLLEMRGKMVRPTGIDEKNIIVATALPFGPEYAQDAFVERVRTDDLAAMRALPGVKAACASGQIPLSGGGSSTGLTVEGSTEQVGAPYFSVTDQAVETLGVEIAAGRNFVPEDFVTKPPAEGKPSQYPVLMTQALADRLYPAGDALGKTLGGGERFTIVGIIRQMHNSWPDSENVERAMLIASPPGSARRIRYLVRAEPGMREEIAGRLEADLLGLQAGRIVKVQTMEEIKGDTYLESAVLIKVFSAVSALLLAVTSLGIVGVTSFSVTERTRQIGTRRALGATRRQILEHFLVEAGMIAALGVAVGTGIAYGLNFALVSVADAPRLGMPLLIGGMLLLGAASLLAALGPALRACRVPPVVATRTV